LNRFGNVGFLGHFTAGEIRNRSGDFEDPNKELLNVAKELEDFVLTVIAA